MKIIFKLLKFMFITILINQIIILCFNDEIRKKTWKSINDHNHRLNNSDVLNLSEKLKFNLIQFDSGENQIIQFYAKEKMIVSNLTLTKWYYLKS